MTLKDLINATQDKSVNSRVILEVAGRFYQAGVEVLEGDLVVLHADTTGAVDWGYAGTPRAPRTAHVKDPGVQGTGKKV